MIREFLVTVGACIQTVRLEVIDSHPPKLKVGDMVALSPLGDLFSGQGIVTCVALEEGTWKIWIQEKP